MAKQDVNIGVEGNDGTGDSIRESFRKTNENFQELYAVFGQGGQIGFTTLSDTPATIESGKIVTTNAAGTALRYSEIGSDSDLDSESTDSITVDVISVPGKIVLSTSFSAIVDDNIKPTLGSHLDAANFAIGGVQVTEGAATALNSQPGRSTTYSIDDLVITKGYADRRYIATDLPIRISAEPATNTQYTLAITSYVSGNLFISNHGYDSGANGTAFIFAAEDTDPTNLVSGSTYYIRYVNADQLAVYASQAHAQTASQLDAANNKISVSGTIAEDDSHTIVDAGFDSTLTGNFLSDVAVPRDSIVRRQGDTMSGALTLHDHPGDLAGDGTPNGLEDLQAVTKYYVDNTAYSSPEVLHVSTQGDDSMQGVPNGKEGTSYTYAYRTVNAAAKRAAELIKTAPEEPGPYFQSLQHSSGTDSTVISAGVENSVNTITSATLRLNRQYIISEVTGYINYTYPDFTYNIATCERDLGLIIDSLRFDAERGNNANYLSRTAAERYYSSVSGRIAITSQLEQTNDSFEFLGLIIANSILQNKIYNEKAIQSIVKKLGDTPSLVTTTTAHGLKSGNIVEFDSVSGMTEIEGKFVYIKVIDASSFELFTDAGLTVAYDNSAFTNFVSGNIGLRYQTKFQQDVSQAVVWDGGAGGAEPNGASAINTNINLIQTIIANGIEAGADIAFGNRYTISLTNSTAGQLDQTVPTNVDAIPGKVLRGKRSGATARIITYTQDTDSTDFFLQMLDPKDFEAGEEIEMGNFVKAKQISIRVETGIYEEDFPIKLAKNVSLKGDEFRRVIIRPKRRVSQSSYANTYFYRDAEFDGLTLTTTGTPFINQTGVTQGYFGYHYLTDNTKPVNVGASINNLGKYKVASNIVKSNKEFIQDEVIFFIASTYPSLVYNETKCRRDTGLVVDGIVKDLLNGGREFALENQGEYYAGYVGAGFAGQETETAAAIGHITTLLNSLLVGTAPTKNVGTDFDPDITLGKAEPDWAANVTYAQGDFVKKGVLYYRALRNHVSVVADEDTDALSATFGQLTSTTTWKQVDSSVTTSGGLVSTVQFAFDSDWNPPKRNDEMDLFMMDDATIIRNVTVQGQGGFMCVLDPEGQILTKSPYIQTASSFSKSENKKAFRGGMYVDAFAGNIPMRVQGNSGNYTDANGSIGLTAFTIYVESQDVSGAGQGLKLRLPELPAPFYYKGQRFQVNAISNYDSGLGRAILYLDPTSNNSNGWNFAGTDLIGAGGHDPDDYNQDIFLQTAGNRSILGNDFTQINDLAYGLVTNNGAFSEMVSMFTYYTHAAYYAANGSEIRSLNGSNGYGNFGLVAEGADPNEIPDQVTSLRNMAQPAKAFTYGGFTNASGDTSITLYDLKDAPLKNSFLYIDHGGVTGALNYKITNIQNLSDPANDGVIGSTGAIVATGLEAVDNSSVTGTPGTNAVYLNVVQKSTSGSGVGAKFAVTITGGAATFTVSNVGAGYTAGDTITVSGLNTGGADGTNDLTIPVQTAFGTTQGQFSNEVYRFTVQEAGSNVDFYPDLQGSLTNNAIVEYRHGSNVILDGVDTQDISERPSTAVNFDESDTVTYRSTGFSNKDDQNLDLNADETKVTFDNDYSYVAATIDFVNIGTSAPTGGGTLGNAVSDTFLAVKQLTASEATRIVADSTDATNQTVLTPGDLGYNGGMIFAYGGRILQVINYDAITKDTIIGATQASPVVIASTGHNLSNGARVEFDSVGGMTELNGKNYYVGGVTANTYELYTDEGLTAALDGQLFTAYTSGGRWVDFSSVWYVETQMVSATDVNGVGTVGIRLVPTAERNIYCGLQAGTTAEITVAISLLRATGHDFTEIGTGGFNTSNYPNVLLGEPVGGKAAKAGAYSDADDASKAQVWERRKGRVFFISSDNDGFFRVGKYFVVDQSTGSITFAGDVGISRAASLGFKEGVTIEEFSNDELFTDLSDTAVPTEKAVANYVSRRLGHDGSAQLTGTSRIAPGFLALDGSTPLEANLNANSKQIKNLLDPTDDNDATTKDYVNQAVSNYDELDDLRNVTIHTVVPANSAKQILTPTGKKRLVVEPEAPGLFTIGGTITDGTAQGTVVALESRFDKVINTNIRIVTYTLTTVGDFSTTASPINNGVVGSSGATTAAVLENPVDEFTNAHEATNSDINITVNRLASSTEIDLQIEAQAIINSDVNDDANIAQSKMMMKRAKAVSSSAGLFGVDDDAGTGRTGQASRGLAAFEKDSFAEDIEVTVTGGVVTAITGDVIIQGTNRGYVLDDVAASATIVLRTSDTWATDGTILQRAAVDNITGVEASPTQFTGVSVLSYNRSGYVSLKDRGIGYSKLPQMNTDTVIGRQQASTGRAESVTFAQVIDQGLGLADGDFSTALPYFSSGIIVGDPGEVLVKTGAGAYAISDISYDNTNTSIAKRRNDGSLQATSLIIGGVSTYKVLSESGATLTFATPGQGTILTASGTSKPTINTGGAIRVGDIAAYSESTFHANSTFGSTGGAGSTEETSALAARWIYSSFIEAPGEKGAGSTGIGIGAGTGFTEGGADIITFVATGGVRAKVTATGIETNAITSITDNTDLTLTANGTGKVYVNDTFQWTGTATGSITGNAGTITSQANSATITATSANTASQIVQRNGSGNFSAGTITAALSGNATTATTASALSGTSITTGAAATAGSITGNWSLTSGSRMQATYADLAEYYEGDVEYEVGTVLVFGGDKEVTGSTTHRTTRVAGVVSDQSAYIMNSGCPGIKTCVALQGRVPVKVIGNVAKGDMLVASAIPGYAVVDDDPKVGTVIGKAVGTKEGVDRGIVEVVVGRV